MKDIITEASKAVDRMRSVAQKLEDLKVLGRFVHEAHARRAWMVELGENVQKRQKPKNDNLKQAELGRGQRPSSLVGQRVRLGHPATELI